MVQVSNPLRYAVPLVVALLTLTGCGPGTDAPTGGGSSTGAGTTSAADTSTGAGTTDERTPASTTTAPAKETSMTPSDPHTAARAERPATEAALQEVVALVDTAEELDPGSIDGATAACSWDAGGPVSWVSRAKLRADGPEAAVRAAADRLPERWSPADGGATSALLFRDADGFLLRLSWQTGPDYVGIDVESPCHG